MDRTGKYTIVDACNDHGANTLREYPRNGTLYVVGGHIKRFDRNGLHDCVAHNEAYTPGE